MGFGIGVGLLLVLCVGFASLAWGTLPRLLGYECPQCHRGDTRWTYARRDGQRDLRYSYNPRFCAACGWSSVTQLDRSVNPALTLSVSAGGGAAVPVAVRKGVRLGQTPEESHLIAGALERIARQSGPAARRTSLQAALKDVRTEQGRHALIDHASRIEVSSILDQGHQLTPRVFHKRLRAALDRLLGDEYDDELQREAIGILRRELLSLDDDSRRSS